MKRNSLLFLLLLALLAPWTANAQTLFSEGFEGGSMPTGWSQDGPNTWTVGSGDYSASTGAGLGTYNALITHGTTGNVTKLITPEIDLSSVTSATLSFMHVQRSWAGDIDELRVYYRTSSTGTWTQLVEYTGAVSSWTTEEDIALPNTSATYQLAFEYTDNYGYGVGLDQVVISAPSACPKPTLGPAEYISEESASFQWTENGSATQWQLQYSTSADFANPTTIDRSGIPALVVRDLSSGTTYYFRVRSSCSVGEYSDWSNVVSFHTLCQTYSLPYAYGFEDAGDLDCWTVDYTANTPGINSDEAHAGSNCFRFSSYNNASSYDQYLISPAFNDAGSKEFSFYYKPYRSGTEKFTVGYSTTTNETSAFTWGDEIVTTAGNDWTLYEATYPAGTKYVAIHYYSNYAYYLYVDDFNFEISSGCSKPTDLALTASSNTVTATWNGTADTYNIDINGTVTNNVTSPYTFTGEFATIYTVMVQANCGGGETSGWTNPQNVATDLCAPEDMCELTFELTDSWGDGWNGAYISVIDVASGIEIVQMSADDHGGGSVASTDTKTLAVCNGRVINFVWVGGSYDSETSYVVKDINGEVIFSGVAGDGLITNYTVNCTPPACPKPTNLTVTNLMPTSANLNWEGNAESYNVQYRKAASIDTGVGFFDDFENGLGNWTLIVNAEGTGWQTFDATAFNGGSNYSGNYVAMARSYEGGVDITADNWMITSKFTSIPSTMTYWARNDGRDDHLYDETYDVCVSTRTNSTSDFEIVQTFTTTPNEWEQITIDLSAYAGLEGYIAFHHHDAEKDMLLIDDVFIGSMNIIPAGEWIEATTTNNFIEITGLEEDADYEWQVQADCGENGESDWVAGATFHTPTACSVSPTDLTAEVTGNAAELSWTGTTETYNLQYREVDPSVPATIILNIPADVWGDGSGYQMLLDADATAYGTIFPETGALTSSGDASEETYAEFEYKLPTDADGSCSTSNILVEGSISLEIPAGTYDWCITNPTPDDRIWIASSNGNVGGRQDDYVFEPGTTYEFTIYLGGSNDAVDVTITDNNEWTLFEGVNNPYTLENLSAQTTYKYQVQGVDCDGNGNNTDWSANATFTTGEFYTKHIEAYSSEEGVNDGWYFIASPVDATVTPSESNGFLTNDYDLYYFNQNGDTDGMEWINHEVETFDIENGNGYLYANSQDVDLVFTGTAYSGTTKDVTLTYSTTNTDANMHGWNLVGNPFNEIAYINMPFYTLDGGSEYDEKAAGEAINPMQGVLVHTDAEATLTFSTTPINKNARLMLNLTQGRNIMDRAIVCFNESKPLPKKQLRDNSTKVYFPIDSKDYAVVSANNQGEMPVSFKAEENGTYTLSINTEDVEFGYLHLIDNMTGNDVDLLSTPSYTFDAKTTDYASRFRLVFATGNADDNFAFYSNGSFVINNEGNATLQVVDVTGRILKSESINGCTNLNINAAQGVYMLRLVNGENVKVQKVVVR